jgi:hypothetical protein
MSGPGKAKAGANTAAGSPRARSSRETTDPGSAGSIGSSKGSRRRTVPSKFLIDEMPDLPRSTGGGSSKTNSGGLSYATAFKRPRGRPPLGIRPQSSSHSSGGSKSSYHHSGLQHPRIGLAYRAPGNELAALGSVGGTSERTSSARGRPAPGHSGLTLGSLLGLPPGVQVQLDCFEPNEWI